MPIQESEVSLMRDAGYKAAWDKLMLIRMQLSEADRNVSELNSRGPGDEVKTNKERKVEAILNGQDPELVEGSTWREDLDKARERYRLLYAAEKAQADILKGERVRASREIAQGVKSEYSEIIRDMAVSLIKLGGAVIKERELREELNGEQVSYQQVFEPQPLNTLGHPFDATSRMALWLKECVRCGYVREDDIPKAWREAWKKGWGANEARRKTA